MKILEVWKEEVSLAWRPAIHGNRYQAVLTDLIVPLPEGPALENEALDILTFSHDHLGRVYCEGLYISTFPKLRKIASNGN